MDRKKQNSWDMKCVSFKFGILKLGFFLVELAVHGLNVVLLKGSIDYMFSAR